MIKTILTVFMIITAASLCQAGRMASEGFVSNRVAILRAEMQGSNAVIQAAADAAQSTGTNALAQAQAAQAAADTNAGSISVLQTSRVDKVWSSTTNYMDGNGIFYEIVTTYEYANSFVVTAVNSSADSPDLGEIFRFLRLDIAGTETNYVYRSTTDPELRELTCHSNIPFMLGVDYWEVNYITAAEDYYYQEAPNTTNALNLAHVNGEGTPIPGEYILLDETNEVVGITVSTNIIDKSVTTNGTIIIIGYLKSESGTVTGEISRAGSTVTTNIFMNPAGYYTQTDVDNLIAAIPRVPTNAYTGFLFHDLGTNIWLNLAPSNLEWEVWEVEL